MDDRAESPADRVDFEALFREFGPRLRAFFLRRGAAPTLAEELTQEVMLTVWSKARMYDPARASLATWVFTIARNKYIDAHRRMRRPEADAEDPCFRGGTQPLAPDESARDKERAQRLRQALARLADEQRETLEQLYFGGATMAEIAEREGVALGTVKSRSRRGLEALRNALAEGEHDDEP